MQAGRRAVEFHITLRGLGHNLSQDELDFDPNGKQPHCSFEQVDPVTKVPSMSGMHVNE